MVYLPYSVYQPARLSRRKVQRGTSRVRLWYSDKISESRLPKWLGASGTASTANFNSVSEYISNFSSIHIFSGDFGDSGDRYSKLRIDAIDLSPLLIDVIVFVTGSSQKIC